MVSFGGAAGNGRRIFQRTRRGPGSGYALASQNDWQTTTVDDNDVLCDFATGIHGLPEHRQQLVFRIRRQLAEGVYETQEKLDFAVERLFDELLDDDEEGSARA